MIRHVNVPPLSRIRVMELVGQGCSVAVIAERLGVSKQWLNRVIREEKNKAKAELARATDAN